MPAKKCSRAWPAPTGAQPKVFRTSGKNFTHIGKSHSAEAMSSPASLGDLAESPAFVYQAARVMHEHIIHGGVRSKSRAQPGRIADHAYPPHMQDRQLVGKCLGFFHVVRGDQYRHAIVMPEIQQAIPHHTARNRIET